MFSLFIMVNLEQILLNILRLYVSPKRFLNLVLKPETHWFLIHLKRFVPSWEMI